MKILLAVFSAILSIGAVRAIAAETATSISYRDLTLKLRTSGSFRVPMPSNGDLAFSYEVKFGAPRFSEPITYDFSLGPDKDKFYRHFWDKVFFLDGSYLLVGGEKVPLTCVFISGQDNRFTKKDTPLIPDFVLKVYLVANDYTCTGPVNPAWPANSKKKEMWDTYVYYEIRDPTIMLPADAKIRYRWAEFPAILVDGGGGTQ